MKITVNTTKEIEVEPCIKCGSDDIQIYDGGESAFNYAVGKCKKCKHEITWDVGCLPSMEELVKHWNKFNNIDVAIDVLDIEIMELHKLCDEKKAKIAELMTIQKLRNQQK